MCRRPSLYFAVIAVQLMCAGSLCLAAKDDGDQAHILEMVGWLPSNTETLFVVRQHFIVPEAPRCEGVGYSFAEAMEDHGIFPLITIRDSKYLELLAGNKIRLCLEGSRRFVAPSSGLGLMPYDGCHIIEFVEPVARRSKVIEMLRQVIVHGV